MLNLKYKSRSIIVTFLLFSQKNKNIGQVGIKKNIKALFLWFFKNWDRYEGQYFSFKSGAAFLFLFEYLRLAW